MSLIHPTAVISDDATIGEGATVGPYCVVEGPVKIGAGSVLRSHVAIYGNTTIGKNANIYPFAAIGCDPQDLKFHGEDTSLLVGDNCIIREGVTLNPGTEGGGGETRIGNNCAFLANSHVGHDSIVGDNVIFSNGVLLAGHCHVGNNVIMGGGSAVHQFTRIGDFAFVGGLAGIENDLIPFGSALGNRAYLGGLNLIGLKRASFPRESIHALRQAYRELFAEEGTLKKRVESVSEGITEDLLVKQLLDFIRTDSDRSFCMPR